VEVAKNINRHAEKGGTVGTEEYGQQFRTVGELPTSVERIGRIPPNGGERSGVPQVATLNS
jgi:hypothetical protein